MTAIVIDASMAATWTLDDEKSAAGDEILHEIKNLTRLTTTLFWHEYRSILLSNEKRRRVTKEKIGLLLSDIRSLELKECAFDDDGTVILLAFRHGLSAYDAVYLALAIQENALLAGKGGMAGGN